METRVVVTNMVWKGQTLLLGRKAPNVGPYPNTWHLIGGHVNPGERLEHAVRREIREETGLRVSNVQSLGVHEDVALNKHGVRTQYIYLAFASRYRSGTMRPGSDIVELKWFSRQALKRIKLNRPTKRLFTKIKF